MLGSSRIVRVVTLLFMAATLPVTATAQDYPAKPVKFLVPFLPGGPADIVARLVAQPLGEMWAQPVVVENKPGAAGNMGAEAVAKSPADGYTLLIKGNTLGSNFNLYKNPGYDPVNSFEPVSLLFSEFNVLVVHPTFPANTVKGVIDLANKRPGELTYASSGNGTSTHLAGELFKTMSGVSITHVPYRGVPPAVSDVMGGQVTMMFASIAVVSPYIKAGRLKPIATTAPRRIPLLPETPTIAESGLPGYKVMAWIGILAPAGTPAALVSKINRDVNTILQRPDMRKTMEDRGWTVDSTTPDTVRDVIRSDVKAWGEMISAVGAKLD